MQGKLKVVLVILAGVAAGVVAVWKLAPDRRSAQEQILDALIDIERAIEEKSPRGCMKYVSDSYRDPLAESELELRRLVIAGLRQPGQFEVVLQPNQPVIQGNEAVVEVRVDFAVVRGRAVQRMPPFDVQTRWVKEKRKWRVVEAKGYMEAEQALEGSY